MMNYRTNSDILSSESFSELYEYSQALVQISHSKGHKYIFKENNKLYVQMDKLIKRREFSINVWNQSIENYYEIIENIGTSKFTQMLSDSIGGSKQSWRQFFDNGLFSVKFKEKSLLSYKVNKKMWRFFKFTQKYIRSNK